MIRRWSNAWITAFLAFVLGACGLFSEAPTAARYNLGSEPTPVYPAFNTEEYGVIDEAGFVEARRQPLSTFSIDVDAASYSNTRRFLNQGLRPPKDAVRLEELINYFSYEYPGPQDQHPFAITTELAACPWNMGHELVHIGLQGRRVAVQDIPPTNLVFLLDVSGSMNSADKLPLLKAAFRLLVDQLRPMDRVAIVAYAGAAGLVLDSTPGSEKREILAALDQLDAGGSTAGGKGIKLAYKVARANWIDGGSNRVILATDGDFNVGVSSDAQLVRLIEAEREDGVFLTVLGFGTGNLKDSKMEQLADRGNGNYAYIDNILEAEKVLISQMGGTLFTIAKDVKIQVEFNPARVRAYRLIGYENRRLQDQDFNDDRKDAGELGAGHSVTALYELVPVGSEEEVPGVDPLQYQQTELTPAAQGSGEVLTLKLRYKDPAGEQSKLIVRSMGYEPRDLAATSNAYRFSAAVAAFGMLLRDSQFMGAASFGQVLELAQGALGRDEEGYRAEFVKLVRISESLGD